MESIRDGKGRGYLAGVDANGYLATRSVNIPQTHYHAEDEANAFVATFEHLTVEAGVKEVIGVFDYTGKGAVVIARMGFNTNAAGRTAFYLYAGTTTTSGGVELSMNNTNAGSRYSLEASLLYTDHGLYPIHYSDLGAKMWELYAGYHTVPYLEINTDNAFIITPGTKFAIIAKSETVGDKVGANIFVFEDNH